MLPLDVRTRMKVTDALTRANMTGRDLAEYLHTYGLLASEEWFRTVQADAIATLAKRMSAHPATMWHTEQVASWLQKAADETRKG